MVVPSFWLLKYLTESDFCVAEVQLRYDSGLGLLLCETDFMFVVLMKIVIVVAGNPSKTLITRLTTQQWLDVGTEWHQEEDRSSQSVLSYEYRVMCDEHYYGSGCANLCRPRNDRFGHFTCSDQGDRICAEGWKGDYCTERKSSFLHLSLS